MKKLFFTLCLILLAVPLSAQMGRYDGIAINQTGAPIGGVTVLVCNPGSGTNPCTGAAIVYANRTGSAIGLNPFTADGIGNYGFYAVPGRYDISFTGTGLTPFTLVDQLVAPDPAAVSVNWIPSLVTGLTLGNSSFQWDLFARNITVSGTITGGTSPTTSIKSLNGILFADQFSGSGGTAKQNTAIASAGTAATTIFDTTALAAGNPTTIPNNIGLFDWRQTQDILTGAAAPTMSRSAMLNLNQNVGELTTVAMTGTVTCTTGSNTCSGVGTKFLTEANPLVSFGRAIKASGDPTTCWAPVLSASADSGSNVLTLAANYPGGGCSGGAGTYQYFTTQTGIEITNVASAGTPNTAGGGETIGLTVLSSRTGGLRPLYGVNLSTSFYTVSTGNLVTDSQTVSAMEVDVNNFAPTDVIFPWAPLNSGIHIVSAGTKKAGSAISIYRSANNTNEFGAGIWENQAWDTSNSKGAGIRLDGAKNHILFVPLAPDANTQIHGTNTAATVDAWRIANNGSGCFMCFPAGATGSQTMGFGTATPDPGSTIDVYQTQTDPTSSYYSVLGIANIKASSGPNAKSASGGIFQSTVDATSSQNLTAIQPSIIVQPIVGVGATGTISEMDGAFCSPAINAATVSKLSCFHAAAPSGAGTVTTGTPVLTDPLAGISYFYDGIKTSGPITSNVPVGTAPMSIASTTFVPNLTTSPYVLNHSGTQIINGHFVVDTCVLGTSCVVTLAANAVYSSNTNYEVQARDVTTAANAVTVSKVDGAHVTFTGTGTDTISYILYPASVSGGGGGGYVTLPLYAGAVTDAGGAFSWSNPNNAKVSDSIYATSSPTAGLNTNPLQLTSYGFSPQGSTVVGIAVVTQVATTSGTGCKDVGVQLMKAGVPVGNVYSVNTPWSSGGIETNNFYGSATDLWGTTWTIAQVSNAGFGVQIQAINSSGSAATCGVDAINITIYTQ